MDKKLKILYLPCHSILEYDEVKILQELGHEVFSMGSYINPTTPHDQKRPPLPGEYNDHLISVANLYGKDNLHSELVDPFDVVIVQHVTSWITNNWKVLRGKKVVWRTIGQSIAYREQELIQARQEGLHVLRYSPKEENIAFNIGTDAMIRFYKDPEEYGNWNGMTNKVMTLAQSMKKRGAFTHFDTFDEATKGFDRVLYGADNADAGDLWAGQVNYDELKKALRDHRVFFYTGTQPASYTLSFIEAMMTGIPIVAVGKAIGNSEFQEEQDTYEITDIIQNGQNGFVSDNIEELRGYISMLLNDHETARRIGEEGRQTAIKLFGKEQIKAQWEEFLRRICLTQP